MLLFYIRNIYKTMIKKGLVSIMLLLAVAISASAAGGQWRIHPKFVSSEAQQMVEMGERVYYLVSHNLYCYDMSTLENEAWNKQNYLSDVNITGMFHNPDKDYIVLTYDNGNLDVIEADGHVRNLSEIKNSTVLGGKNVNDVTFAGDVFYAATDFGYVVYNDNKWEVKESRIYTQKSAETGAQVNVKMLSVARVGDYIVLANDTMVYSGLASQRHEALSSYTTSKLSMGTNMHLCPLEGNDFFVLGSRLYRGTVSSTGVKVTTEVKAKGENIQKTADGYMVNFMSQGYYYTFDKNGGNPQKVEGGNELYCEAGDGSLWSVAEEGLHNSKAPESYYKPISISISNPFWLTYNEASQKMYVTNTGTLGRMLDEQYDPTVVNVYDGTRWTDVTPSPILNKSGTYWITFSPEDAEEYYLGSWWNGVYKVKGTDVAQTYNWENSPMIHALDGYYCHAVTTLDRQGNLWVAQTGNGTTPVMVLPSAKRRLESVATKDWIDPKLNGVLCSKFARILATKQNNYIVYTNGNFGAVMVWDYNGDPSGTIAKASYPNFLDQDNKTYEWSFIFDFAEDQNGLIWMGSSNGIISFDPKQAFNSNFRINRIKVPRNDGTDLADYLLDGMQVNCIAVDASNCKWIGTNNHGVFYVNPDGSQIIRQFTTENSQLLSNKIYDICCNEASNSVFITTGNGLIEYFSDSSNPIEGDMSNVIAYPNPVRPDYGGNITITGLKDNCLVKIADSAGNVVTQMRSVGGTAVWDARTPSGDRVKSGVYFVLASTSGTGSSLSAVSKILIMR